VSDSSASAKVLAEYRQPPQYRRPYLARFIISGVLTGLLTWGWVEGHAGELLLGDSFAAPIALYSGVVYIWRDRFLTRLTTDGIEIRGYFNHFVPWPEVRAIAEEGYGPSRPLDAGYDVRVRYRRRRSGNVTSGPRAKIGVIRVIRNRGRSKILRAPLVTSWAPDPYFETKLRQMQQLSGQYGTRPAGG
jgi:hypothetical protein